MTRVLRQPAGPWRHVFMTLAALAVALKVLIPPGFMAGPATNDLPFALVFCTGQGATVVQPGEALPDFVQHGKDAPDEGARHSPCVFAGHGAAAPVPTFFDVSAVEFVSYVCRPPAEVAGLAPGRGLTGPPLPARGPPTRLI